ncbi:hypothetical protein GCM10010412_064910 [Nonomuraea recticatena]|uniref:Uncharacterized protein n=1 Tax=Nonomuraea recticatena TaxID=46178 RepID=A0ABN3SLT1_9ACTN
MHGLVEKSLQGSAAALGESVVYPLLYLGPVIAALALGYIA